MEKTHYFENLTPFVSTQFRCMGIFGGELIMGKIYNIERWYHTTEGETHLEFINEYGVLVEWERDLDVEDYSYNRNLKEILKE